MKHVAVLKGGWSAERDVSLNSGAACAKALRHSGYQVTEVEVDKNIETVLDELKPDVVFNALHGTFGEDGGIQEILEKLQIPYTHSGVEASRLAMDKPGAKEVFDRAGLQCPKGITCTLKELKEKAPLPRPFVVKPACEGSSVGVYIVTEENNQPLSVILADEKEDARLYLVEEYIPGRELTVAVLNDTPLGVTEIKPVSGFYDYANKYTEGKTEHICPAKVPESVYNEAMEMALKAHQVLGCRGLSRADFRYDESKNKGNLYLLEVNTQPGMTALSLAPELAAHAGISFNELVKTLVESARLGS